MRFNPRSKSGYVHDYDLGLERWGVVPRAVMVGSHGPLHLVLDYIDLMDYMFSFTFFYL